MNGKTRAMMLACFIASACGVQAVPARAETLFATRNPVESCQGALPHYDNALRKRPLGITNEGSSTVFVTCSMANVDKPPIFFGNIGDVTVRVNALGTVTCILVPLHGINSTFEAYTRSVTNQGDYPLNWNATLMDRPGWHTVNLSCSLSPGSELLLIEYEYYLPDD